MENNKPHICVIIFKVAVILLMIDYSFALWKIADNIAKLIKP